MLSKRSSPALVSAAAASELPRAALLALLVIFILPRLFSTELWTGRDLTSFGIAWSMIDGLKDSWLFPNVDGAPAYTIGPLTAWIGALSMATIGKITGPIIAFHLTSGLWFAVLTASIWYATYLLSRRDEAQPLAFIFGGEAARKDYGRVVADLATLMLVATYGTVLDVHEVTPETTLLALSGLLLFGVVLGLEKFIRGSVVAGVACGLAFTTASLSAGIWFTLAAWCAIFFTPDYTSRSKRAAITLSTAAVTAAVWPALAFITAPAEAARWFSELFAAEIRAFSPFTFSDYLWLIKNIAWATLPSWPFAAFALYSWRKNRRSAHIAAPLAVMAVALCSILFTGIGARSTLFCAIPSLVVLAAFGLASAKRSKENILDLFSGIIFTLGLLVIWVYFFAWYTGTPTKMAYSITRLAPAVAPHINAFGFTAAAAATVFWGWLAYWRFFKHPIYLWRGAWMAACGLTAAWITVMGLFGSLVDGARSMEYTENVFSSALQKIESENGCVSGDRLTLSDRAAFNYYSHIRFSEPGSKQCKYELVKVDAKYALTENNEKVLASIHGRPRSSTIYLLQVRE